MNYLNIYNSLIEKARTNIFNADDYFETHHIILKGLGGTDDNDNLVKMTARQHFVAHWLLFRIYPTNKKIAAAFHIIAFGTNCRNTRKKHQGYMPSSRSIAEARQAKVFHNKGNKHSPETIQKMKNTWQEKIKNGYIGPTNGKITSDETKEKQSLSKLGKERSIETIDKIRATKKKQHQEYLNQNNGVKKKLSTDTKNKIRQAAIERNNTLQKYEDKKQKEIEFNKLKRQQK